MARQILYKTFKRTPLTFLIDPLVRVDKAQVGRSRLCTVASKATCGCEAALIATVVQR